MGQLLAALLLLLLARPAWAMDGPGVRLRQPSWAEQQSGRCLDAITAAEMRHRTLPGLLPAIARAESGRPVPPLPGLQPWPWAVNAGGRAFYFDSKAAAVAWVRVALERGVDQVDVGCMQINLQSHPRAFASLDEAFEPASNADYAARFLLRLREDAAGNWYAATGWYHSRTVVLAEDYRARVTAIANNHIPALSLGVPLYIRAIQQGTLRIALPGGGVMRINLRRQPSARGHARPGACQVAMILGPFMPARARAAACASAKEGTRDPTREAGTAG